MRIESPTLQLNKEASISLLSTAIIALEGKDNPFLILSKTHMTYMQVLWTPDGFVLEYQEGSIAKHYVVEKLISADAARAALIHYLNGIDDWKSAYEFSNKGLIGPWWRIGYSLGQLLGRICAPFRRL